MSSRTKEIGAHQLSSFMHVKMVADVWLVAVGEIKAGLQTSLSS